MKLSLKYGSYFDRKNSRLVTAGEEMEVESLDEIPEKFQSQWVKVKAKKEPEPEVQEEETAEEEVEETPEEKPKPKRSTRRRKPRAKKE